MITFKKETTIQVVEKFNEERDIIVVDSLETFKAGELVDAEIIEEDGPFVTLEFGNGGVAFTIERELFVVILDKKA